jgi:hypothetical protein
MKRPGQIEATAPLRGLASVGPLSGAFLIANEPLRLIASFRRVEVISTGLWWLYLVTYVPLTLIVAGRSRRCSASANRRGPHRACSAWHRR